LLFDGVQLLLLLVMTLRHPNLLLPLVCNADGDDCDVFRIGSGMSGDGQFLIVFIVWEARISFAPSVDVLSVNSSLIVVLLAVESHGVSSLEFA
jgi:hypothetical protein